MNKLLILLLFISFQCLCQERKGLSGRVVLADNTAVPNVFVINKATGTETKTDAAGSFAIPARAGDKLAVYSADTEVREFAISDASFAEVPYVLSVDFKGTEMEEVVVNAVTSQSLGIVPKGQKQYTQMERKLYTTGDFKPIMLLGLLGGGMPLDPLMNAINGRTKKVKKEVDTERRAMMLKEIHNIYTPEEITAVLKVPDDTIDGFLFYVAEDVEFAATMKAKNETMAKFLMVSLARKYLALSKDE